MRTTTTVLLAFGLVGCAGEDGEATAAEPGTCDGGGTLSVELGDGGRNDFMAFSDGEVLPVEQAGFYGVGVELWTSGLNTTESVTLVARLSVDGGPATPATALRNLLCDDEVGYGWDSIVTPFDDDYQSDPASVDGLPYELTVVITDTDGETATGELTGTLSY